MYYKSTVDDKTLVRITCDRKRCAEFLNVTALNHNAATGIVCDQGWRMYRDKQFCPKHAEQVRQILHDKAEAPHAG